MISWFASHNSVAEKSQALPAIYHCVFLVHCEHFRDIRDAIAREKQLKGWRREKKNALLAETNPRWDDLAAEWY